MNFNKVALAAGELLFGGAVVASLSLTPNLGAVLGHADTVQTNSQEVTVQNGTIIESG